MRNVYMIYAMGFHHDGVDHINFDLACPPDRLTSDLVRKRAGEMFLKKNPKRRYSVFIIANIMNLGLEVASEEG